MLEGINYKLINGNLNLGITGISYDSRNVKPGSIFVCIKGFKTDGHKYINQAIENGAVAILVEDDIKVNNDITIIKTDNNRKALSKLADNFFKHPSQQIRVIGVTGTNGKTTITHLIKSILENNRKKVAIMGTLYAKIGNIEKDLRHTTPEALEIAEFMDLAVKEKCDYVIMEVSSHALDLHRVDDVDFDVAIFSNLTQDHLDYHQNMEHYRAAKLKLFNMIKSTDNNFSIVNADDSNANYFIEESKAKALTYGINKSADVKANNLKISLKGTKFTVNFPKGTFNVNMHLVGLFSVYNALAAIAFALQEGIAPSIIKDALEKVTGIPGRFERVNNGQDFSVIVDYAHTPDGLENILATARKIVENRLITVFGCGGDRDRSKRPLMGEIAAKYSDFCIVTSDNPRTEDPDAIISDIIPGLNRVENSRYAVIVDRKEAIRHAIYSAKKGDVIIIAGKGHETYQLVGDKVLHFDDREIARDFLKGKEQ